MRPGTSRPPRRSWTPPASCSTPQDTGVLEDGKGYSREKMAAFLKAWKG
ncbi:MAG: hypothetical protein IPL96_07250 [Holophagaceae bacterium]|nr:hypothetical protein [Holophagaceae bacterium]